MSKCYDHSIKKDMLDSYTWNSKEEDVPKNLCLRVSAIKVDSPPPKFWKWTSGVHKDKRHKGRECPAPKQNGECGDCRACWSRSIKQVSYKEH